MMRTVLKILLGVLVFASISLSFISYSVKTLLNDNEKYAKNILTEEFDRAELSDIEAAIREEGDQLALDYDRIIGSLDKEQMIDFAHSYARAFLDSVLNDTKFSFDSDYASDGLYDEILRQITLMGDEAGLTAEEIESDCKTVYEMLRKDIDSSLKFIPEMVTNKTDQIRNALNRVKPYTEYGTWFLVFGAVLTVMLAFVSMYKDGVPGGAFYVVLPYWFASTLVFVPAVMFAIYDSTSKIIIARSPLYYMLSGVLKTVEKQMLDSSVVFFVITTLLTFLSAYYMIFKRKNDNTQKECPKSAGPDEQMRIDHASEDTDQPRKEQA